MKCRDIRAELPDFVRSRMDAEAIGRISEHLAGCPRCSEEARELEVLFQAIESKPWTPPQTYWASILPRIHGRMAEQGAKISLPQWATRYALPLAAAIVLAVGCFKIAPGPGEDLPESFSAILAQLPADELQEVADQQAVAEILHPDLAVTEPSLASVDDLESVKAILREEGGGTADVDAETVTGFEDSGIPDAPAPAPVVQGLDSLH